jgi:hypothetical protein
MSPLEVALAVLAAGGVLGVRDGALRVRMPRGVPLAPELTAALRAHRVELERALAGDGRDLAATVANIRALEGDEREHYPRDLAHDLAAYVLAMAGESSSSASPLSAPQNAPQQQTAAAFARSGE